MAEVEAQSSKQQIEDRRHYHIEHGSHRSPRGYLEIECRSAIWAAAA